MDSTLTLFLALFLIPVVVLVHEAGHFVAARAMGVEVEAFALGWGKVLWSWKPGRTEYRLCLLPLGGYCKMKGEADLIAALNNPEQPFEPSEGSLFAAKPWRKIVISAAGPVFNLTFAAILLALLSWSGWDMAGPPSRLQLYSDISGDTSQPADRAGLQTGDLVKGINGKLIQTFPQLQKAISRSNGRPLTLEIERKDRGTSLVVVPRKADSGNGWVIGILSYRTPLIESLTALSPASLTDLLPGDLLLSWQDKPLPTVESFVRAMEQSKTVAGNLLVLRDGRKVTIPFAAGADRLKGVQWSYQTTTPMAPSMFGAFSEGLIQTGNVLQQMVTGLSQLFLGAVSPFDALSGPIGIVKMGSEVLGNGFSQNWSQGIATTVSLLAMINLALFLMNLLPIPALDGGSIVLSGVEAIRRKPVSLATLLKYQQVGGLLVLFLVLFTTLNDLGVFKLF